MITNIKAEFQKLFTVRSTYIVLGLSALLELFFAFYASGWRAKPMDLANPNFLSNQVTSALVPLTLLVAIVAVLLVTHEYRYNTIMYTLTSSKSRTKVLASKFIAISGFTIIFALLFGALSPLLAALGVAAHGLNLGTQFIPVWSLIWRGVFYCWGFAILASIIAFIIRIQVGAIVAMFLIPGTIEQLLGILLKHNQVYLPFSSLAVLVSEGSASVQISYLKAATVAFTYIVAGWLITWVLFIKRDAN